MYKKPINAVLASSNKKVEKQIKLAMIEKIKEIEGLETESLNILNNIHRDVYEDSICKIEEFINDKIYEIMENLEPEDYKEFYFDRKDAVGCYDLGFNGLCAYVFNLNDEYAFVGCSNGENFIEAKKTKITFNEEGKPCLKIDDEDVMLSEIVRLN